MNDTSLQADRPCREEAPSSHVAEPRTVATPRPYLPTDPRRKSLFLTGLFSLMPGLGHIDLGYYQRGFIHFFVFGSTISLVLSGQVDGLGPLLYTFLPFFWLFNQIDALRRATRINLTLEGIENMPLQDQQP